jgi:Flp pilus assembly protein TadD
MWRIGLAAALVALTWLPGPGVARSATPAAQHDPVELTRILALPPELRAQLRAQALADEPLRSRRLERIVEFVFARDGLGMRYREGADHTVAEAYATREANCLGFTLLFLALAREAGLEAFPQEIRETLSWSQQEGTVYRNSHINAGVRIAGRFYTLDVARDAVVARTRARRISDQRLLAHYYNNLAMQGLATRAYAPALSLMHASLALDPSHASHWSNAGVLRLRSGDRDGAARDYAQALQIDPHNAEALFNSVSLAQRRGDARAEAEFRARLVRVQQNDPFHQFLLAMDYERAGDYAQAIGHYQRAIRLHRREPRFYAALAHAYALAGDDVRADQALARAQHVAGARARAELQAREERVR